MACRSSADAVRTSHVSRSPNRLLAILTQPEFERVRPHLERVPLTPRSFSLPASEPMSHVYFPYSGVISFVVTMASGATVEVAMVGKQGMLGVSVALEADPPPYDMVCQVPGEAGRMPAASFTSLLEELPGFRRVVLRYALGLLHEVSRTAACNSLHSVEQRLARWLLLCSDRVGSNEFPLTHEALAQMLGARRPFISRKARALQEAGVIRYSRGAMRLLDRGRLAGIACEDYAATEQEYDRLLG
jgi:CRP-like cAMP-binding protein